MKYILKSALTVIMVICTLIMCASCTRKQKVQIIQNNNKPPETKKSIAATTPNSNGHDYSKDITVELGKKKLTLKTPTTEHSISYDKISELTYMTEWNYGADVVVSGVDNEFEVYAQMQTDENEPYYLYIYKTTPVYIAVYYGGTQYVFNLDSVSATKSCYESIKEKL